MQFIMQSSLIEQNFYTLPKDLQDIFQILNSENDKNDDNEDESFESEELQIFLNILVFTCCLR